ncbi:hypothetical protein [Aporhodopirellula aestuarii]|uniref:Uncharacterized protein n=1 Tax=Aporhodopirellula aestuarii TaxID=2950107 RepID=A0ABT0UEP5_9BACT|nr:hypothetical protein [Aporhodopirellula aestuarii]MCM2375256.1 hypothetical protein [Aporhodopirellula aestuarii]
MSRWRNTECFLLIFVLSFAGKSVTSADAPPDAPITVGGEQSLDKVVPHINEGLEARYALLDPIPMTAARFGMGVTAKIETIASADEKDRNQLVKALQRILAEKRLPERYSLHLISTSAS